MRFGCFITKQQPHAAELSQREASGKRPGIHLHTERWVKMSSGITVRCALCLDMHKQSLSVRTEDRGEIKGDDTLVVASCDKQIVTSLDSLKQLTQGARVTFKNQI